MATERELLRPADLAPLLGVSIGRVYQLIARGLIPAVRVGGAVRVPRAAWEEWLRDRSEAALSSVKAETQAQTPKV
jgi:excisionase family DNA binding protein